MSEVRCSINGKYFKDFGIYVSDSDGLFDALKRKKVNSYDWAEYHGSAPDLSNPKFEAREITLKGFVVGTDWVDMKANFDAIISEFQKAGTQRLLIEPFGLKPLPYEVYMDDSISLKKTFKNGKMVGTFSLKMIEPNPLKIVLYTTGTTLNLSYNSPKETEIFYGNGVKDVVSGNASFSGKILANRVVSGYNFAGRNLLRNSATPIKTTDYWGNYANTNVEILNNELMVTAIGGNPRVKHSVYFPLKSVQQQFVLQIWYRSGVFISGITGKYSTIINSGESQSSPTFNTISNFHIGDNERVSTFVITAKPKDTDVSFWIGLLLSDSQVMVMNKIKMQEGTTTTDWTPAPEDEKYIIIAGNVEEITGLTTNATVLWEKL